MGTKKHIKIKIEYQVAAQFNFRMVEIQQKQSQRALSIYFITLLINIIIITFVWRILFVESP